MSSQKAREKIAQCIGRAKTVIFGQDELLEAIIIAMTCEGHLLIEGMPGLGKTLSVATMARLCDLSFKRIQFTPDLLPSDLIGTIIYNQQKNEFYTKFGPLFTQLLLADEINRSPAKVQSALLEAMAEKQVTIGDDTHKLTAPFVVLATQNPIEQEGTYQLPEAQLDRFMMKVNVNYPNFEEEKKILTHSKSPLDKLVPVLSTDDIINIQEELDNMYVDEKIKNLILKIVTATRPGADFFPKKYAGIITIGASPRACIWLHKISKYYAMMAGRDFVTPEDVLRVVPQVIGHRIILSYEATVDQISSNTIALEVAKLML
ncbi:MAG: MoxR family ATPase [Bdellovibrio sp.]|nr:MoxR family ATPase [Bdellovibrio sp.]